MYCRVGAPSAVDDPWTSTHLLLLRTRRAFQVSAAALRTRQDWLLPVVGLYTPTGAPSDVDAFATSRRSPVALLTSVLWPLPVVESIHRCWVDDPEAAKPSELPLTLRALPVLTLVTR